jgi:hypothetical protein
MARPPHVDAGDWAELQKALKQIGGDGGLTPQQLAAARPEDLGNAAGVEMAWAETAGKYADAHMGVLRVRALARRRADGCGALAEREGLAWQVIKDKRKLRLTAMDDKIYEHFRAVFPDLKVAELSERDLSAPRIKAKFRCVRGLARVEGRAWC